MRKKSLVPFIIFNACTIFVTERAQAIEFDSRVIDISGDVEIDLTQFQQSGPVDGAEYIANIRVNDRLMSRNDNIRFYADDNKVKACIPIAIIPKLGLKKAYEKNILELSEGNCANLYDVEDDVRIHFDDEAQELIVSIPQAYFIYEDEHWDPPAARDSGINGVVLDYNIYDSYSNGKDRDSTHNLNAYGSVGANVGEWRIRADYQYDKRFNNSANNKNSHFKWNDVYAYRDLPSIAAKLKIGDSSLNTRIFDNVRMQGASIYTDENMLPPNLRGYAPLITGVARTNAVVTISQYGSTLKKLQVPPGTFIIDQLSNYISGTLDVTIEEDDGSITEFQVITSSVPFLTRKGQAQYHASIGKLNTYKYDNNVADENTKFFSGEISYGITNNTSVYGGIFSTFDSEYIAGNIGLGLNLSKFGAVSFDVTRSSADISGEPKTTGYSYRFNYAKKLESTNTQVNLMGYRFSDRDYMSTSRFADIKTGMNNSMREKNLITLSLSQHFNKIDASVSAIGSTRTYWDGEKNESVGLDIHRQIKRGVLKGSSISLGANLYRNQGYSSNNISMSFLMPLERPNSSISYFSSYDDSSKRMSNNVSYFRNGGNRVTRLGIRSSDGVSDPTLSAYVNQYMPFGSLTANTSYNKNQHSVNVSLTGSATFTRHGFAFHRQVAPNQPRLIMDVGKGVKGVPLTGGKQLVTNRFGLAVVSGIAPYYRAHASVDLRNIPDDISVEDTNHSVTLTEGAIGYARIGTIKGDQILSQIKMKNDEYPPFGALVLNADTGAQLAMISEQGQAYISGVNPESRLQVTWGQDQSCEINITQQKYTKDGLNEFICK